MTQVAILGAGMAGFGATSKLNEYGITPVVYEKQSYIGGHAASFESGGFIFDDGPHISFTKDKRIQDLFAANVNDEYEVIQARTNNYWKGHWIKHPAQCNLYGLPDKLQIDILYDFITAQFTENCEIRNYKEWLYARFGKSFAETFPMQYGKKFHTTSADNMTTEWIGPRLYRADFREVLQGALSPKTPDVHYVNHFRYPSRGGFIAFFEPLAEKSKIRLNHELVQLDIAYRKLKFANGAEGHYDFLISSLPLPELIPMIDSVPDDVLSAASKLACTNCVIVNIGIDRSDISKAHWTYFYDHDFVFARLSFPHMLSPQNVPDGAGSIQTEIYYSKKYRPLHRSPESFIEPVIRDLKRCGIIEGNDTILFSEARCIPYANVIFDLERPDALAKIHGYLDESGIFYCGRYGLWGYHWTDESFISGEEAAQKVIDGLGI
jgi:protoporphyrinogen oxidase